MRNAGIPPGAWYWTRHALQLSARRGPAQRGQARSASEDRIQKRRQRLHPGAHDQDQSRQAEEDEQWHEPLAPGLAPPYTARAIGDGRHRAREHEQHPGHPPTPADHATSGSARAHWPFITNELPATRRSIPLRRNVEYPSMARLTMGSPARLKLVLSRTGIPVRAPYASSNAWNAGAIACSTVCTRAVPSTCVTAASLSRHSGRTGKTPDMNRASRAPPGGSSKYRSACSSGTAGAKGRNSSRYLMLRLRRS